MSTPETRKLKSDRVLLLTFASDRTAATTTDPYRLVSDVFLSQGHTVLSFDLPNHDTQINEYGEGIAGMRNAFVAGQDPFQRFVVRGRAVIDHFIRQELAWPGRIAVSGTSRGGYMALRLMASDDRIAAGAGFAPVTDWRDLSEFEQDRNRDDVAALRLSCQSDALATRPVLMAIGNHDERVNTESCCRLYLDLCDARRRNGRNTGSLAFYCTDDPGHSCAADLYRKGADFLLEHLR